MASAQRRRSGKSSTSAAPAGDRRPSQVSLKELSNPLISQEEGDAADQKDAKNAGDPVRKPRFSADAKSSPADDQEGGQESDKKGEKKKEKSGSLIGQIGNMLIGEAKGDQSNDDQQKGPSGGGGGDGGGGGTVDTILGTIACSAVQGMRRALDAKSIPVKIFWTLMVLLSIGLFLKAMVTISLRLATWRVERSYQLEKVPFVFPDLYFCPNNAYSGSFPYTLTEAQAEQVNREVERLGKLFDQQFPTSGLDNSSRTRSFAIQQSMPVQLLKDYIMHRPGQSMFYNPLITSLGNPDFKVFVFPGTAGNRLCFKILLSDQERESLRMRPNNEDLRLALFADPYFADFKYSGHPIRPILNPIKNESVPFRVWYPSGIVNMMGSGYTMFIVPIGVYPSMEYEARFKLAPGKSYDIDISMEENQFSDELLGKDCSSDHENAAFVNHLTGERTEFNYSFASCFFTESARNLFNLAGYVQEGIPLTWDLKDSPRWGNLSDSDRINRSRGQYEADRVKANEVRNPKVECHRQQPCVQNKYSASFSFHSWPNTGGEYSHAFSNYNPAERPAISHMVKLARDLDAGNLSIESHAEFRHLVSESLLEVRIRAKNHLATRVLMTASYTLTSYMSDLGGLMGLYLGCSVLTIFELLEILYLKGSAAIRAKYKRRREGQSSESGSGNDETSEADPAEEAFAEVELDDAARAADVDIENGREARA